MLSVLDKIHAISEKRSAQRRFQLLTQTKKALHYRIIKLIQNFLLIKMGTHNERPLFIRICFCQLSGTQQQLARRMPVVRKILE
jgi:hypothetical protein